jgi:integrase
MHKPFHLIKRKLKKKTVYYVRFFDEYDNRLPWRSTGQTSRAAAENWCYEQMKKGITPGRTSVSFGLFAQDWWTDRCQYVAARTAAGRTLSKAYINVMRGMLVNYILPYFKDYRLEKINKRLIEKWLLELRSKALSDVTVNHIFTCLKIMLSRAVEMELIYRDPTAGILTLRETSRERGTLTLDEIRSLFGGEALFDIWGGNLPGFTGSMLPVVTGLRQGEILGLQVQHVFKDHIAVVWSWARGELVPPKWNSRRVVPIPRRAAGFLADLIVKNGYRGPEDFVFQGPDRSMPLSAYYLVSAFYGALGRIGVDEERRRERNIVYHSLRHTFNTVMRGRIPDAKLQSLTGHRTKRMLEHYTHWQLEDYKDVLEAQEQYFSS